MKIHKTDIEHLKRIRESVDSLVKQVAKWNDVPDTLVLDIGPDDEGTVKRHFKRATVRTLNLQEPADIVADLSSRNFGRHRKFDVVFCTEVLEHVKDPFTAILNIRELLYVGGKAVISTPLDFRIHGMGGYSGGLPPDYWRFTESGLRLLCDHARLQIADFRAVDSGRELFPIHYALIAVKV